MGKPTSFKRVGGVRNMALTQHGEMSALKGSQSDDIQDSTDYLSEDHPFTLYVGVAGDVTFRCVGDGEAEFKTKHFIAGYHPNEYVEIVGLTTTATDLIAYW